MSIGEALRETFREAQRQWNPFPLLDIEDELAALVEAVQQKHYCDMRPEYPALGTCWMCNSLDALDEKLRQEVGDGE